LKMGNPSEEGISRRFEGKEAVHEREERPPVWSDQNAVPTGWPSGRL
jgi:hypothetical protein